ncbi:MAG TPA: hypothetical protein VLW54_03455 [Candidatus Acidoferrales bacterium]|nr:hypothetical protein [Candidatus Acidoferrales bacterium]
MKKHATSEAAEETKLKIADEVWIITALLHRERPLQADFTIEEIMERARRESLAGEIRPGLYVHVVQHCVANRPPNPGRYRMLFETGAGRRRLFRKGDPYDPRREGSKITPAAEDMPRGSAFRGLLGWYEQWSAKALEAAPEKDPLLRLAGSGRELWADEHADAYVNRLREEAE